MPIFSMFKFNIYFWILNIINFLIFWLILVKLILNQICSGVGGPPSSRSIFYFLQKNLIGCLNFLLFFKDFQLSRNQIDHKESKNRGPENGIYPYGSRMKKLEIRSKFQICISRFLYKYKSNRPRVIRQSWSRDSCI